MKLLFLLFIHFYFGTMTAGRLKVIIFDLDYTLWPFWVDTHVTPPFRKSKDGQIVDAQGARIKCYPEVPELLKNLTDKGYVIAAASRTGEIKGANQLLDLFNWNKYFTYKEIFPGSKVTHLNNIKTQSKADYNQMIFFDDESRNIKDVSKLGVVSILVKNGVNKSVIENGIREYLKQNP